mmetsp:Transcript_38986/g.83488  ORF Transcript_38986/g.83488 Transcript_38986/m.83488 type:complete len:204 (+) Transcript_38986:1115-1726(+)
MFRLLAPLAALSFITSRQCALSSSFQPTSTKRSRRSCVRRSFSPLATSCSCSTACRVLLYRALFFSPSFAASAPAVASAPTLLGPASPATCSCGCAPPSSATPAAAPSTSSPDRISPSSDSLTRLDMLNHARCDVHSQSPTDVHQTEKQRRRHKMQRTARTLARTPLPTSSLSLPLRSCRTDPARNKASLADPTTVASIAVTS